MCSKLLAVLCAVALVAADKATPTGPLEITAKDGKVRVEGKVGGKSLSAEVGSIKFDREKQALILIGTDKDPVSVVMTEPDGIRAKPFAVQTVVVLLANEQVITIPREWGPDIDLAAPGSRTIPSSSHP
jgi:hypothetical protein